MLRRDPTRIELRPEDLAEFEAAREHYLETMGAKARAQHAYKAATRNPPPTPADADLSKRNNSGSSTSSGSQHKSTPLDPIHVAYQERKGKTTKDRILGE
ncbi:hypothetical protein BGZ68_009749 [Mortierella alpina]|nr:hypothetical protein BGZ68_009749 [Mortierella alpina]